MKRVVGVWRYVEDVVEVWMPRPRRTVRDSSVACQRRYIEKLEEQRTSVIALQHQE
jgi:hypothetical protein